MDNPPSWAKHLSMSIIQMVKMERNELVTLLDDLQEFINQLEKWIANYRGIESMSDHKRKMDEVRRMRPKASHDLSKIEAILAAHITNQKAGRVRGLVDKIQSSCGDVSKNPLLAKDRVIDEIECHGKKLQEMINKIRENARSMNG